MEFYKQILDNLYDGVYFVDNKRIITYWNKGAEQITGYSEQEVTGKSCSDNLLVHCDQKGTNLCKGMCPLAKSIESGIPQEHQVFLLHKQGHRIPVFVRAIPIRDDLDRVTGAVEIFNNNTQQLALNEKMKQLAKLAFSDGLTGLYNRRYTEMKLSSMLAESKKDFPPFGLLYVDVHFADSPGPRVLHNMDNAIKVAANTISANIQPTDMVCRWKDNKFLVITPNAKKSLLLLLADKLRTLTIQSKLSEGQLQAAIGATLSRVTDTTQSIIARAEAFSQNSKEVGSSAVTIDPNI